MKTKRSSWHLYVAAVSLFTVAFTNASLVLASDATLELDTGSRVNLPVAKALEAPALRPGATALAYILVDQLKGGEYASEQLSYLELRSNKTVVVNQGRKSGNDDRPLFLAPTWSPDGTKLAYRLKEEGAWRVHVWRPKDGVDLALAHQGGSLGDVLWSPNGRMLYFIAEVGDAEAEEVRIRKTFIATEERRPAPVDSAKPAGITVLVSDGSPARLGPSDNGDILANGELIAADLVTGKFTTLLTTAGLGRIQLSPDGRNLLARVGIGRRGDGNQLYFNWHIIPLSAGDNPPPEKGRNVPETQPGLKETRFASAAWSPDSSKLAFVDNGALSKGDIFVYDLTTKAVRTLSSGVLAAELGESEPRSSGSAWTMDAPRGKFDSSGLSWSNTGDVVYALRRTALGTDWRTRLWAIPLNGIPRNLTVGASYDVSLPLPSRGSQRFVAIRRPDGNMSLGELPEETDKIVRITPVAGEFYLDGKTRVAADFTTGKVAFVSASDKAPDEAFIFNPRTRGIRQITHANLTFPRTRLPSVDKVEWTSRSGPHFGYLYIPPNSTALPPLIVQVYPREPSALAVDGMRFPGRDHIFLPPVEQLLYSGYAVFKPDIPVVGEGRTCPDVASNLDLALEAIGNLKLADPKRAAVIGASFGGWAVNCVITQTHRFRAAISIAGGSELVSLPFSLDPITRNWSIGGGQTDIDKTIWQAPDLYWRESPVSGAENVSTPLLLIHGTGDSMVPWSQSAEMYSALSNMGKDVTLVTYDGANHGNVIHHPDISPRIAAWVEKYLGKP